jgi:hypothetical protein
MESGGLSASRRVLLAARRLARPLATKAKANRPGDNSDDDKPATRTRNTSDDDDVLATMVCCVIDAVSVGFLCRRR